MYDFYSVVGFTTCMIPIVVLDSVNVISVVVSNVLVVNSVLL